MPTSPSESDLRALLVRHLESDGWVVATEVRAGSKWIDVAAQLAGERMTVEVKVRDWKRAAKQAFLNVGLLGQAYIALPSNPRRRVDGDYLRLLGVGLIEFDELSWSVVLESGDLQAFREPNGKA